MTVVSAAAHSLIVALLRVSGASEKCPPWQVTWAGLSTEAPPGDQKVTGVSMSHSCLVTYQPDTQCACEGASDPEDSTRSSSEVELGVTLKQKTGHKDKDAGTETKEES